MRFDCIRAEACIFCFGGIMNISFIGAGKVGMAIGKYISKQHDVLYYYSKTESSAIKAATYVSCQSTTDITQLIDASELIFITTSDDAIEMVSKEISLLNVCFDNKLFVHMSGALTSQSLNSLEKKGAKTCSLHPLQTFSSIDAAVYDLENTYFSVEGDVLMEAFVRHLGNPYFTLTKDQKTKYHLSACIFSNYLVTLMDFGTKMLNDIGIDEDQGLKAMKPLIDATLSNIYKKGIKASLTGPIQRGDTITLEKHMSELEGLDLGVYQLLGKMTTDRLVMDKNKKSMLDALWRQL